MAWTFSKFILVLGAGLLVNSAFVDPQYRLVDNWTGWGTSLAWFSDVLGGLDQAVQDEMNFAMFSVCFK